jgi:peptidoglycan/xylan/chitin deacetylase (PgdA/CDA1 family)/lysophospholipase L1-like esterase
MLFRKEYRVFFIFIFFASFISNAQNDILLNSGFENATLTNWIEISGGTTIEGTVGLSMDTHAGDKACIANVTVPDLINKFTIASDFYTTSETKFTFSVWAKTDVADGKQFKLHLLGELGDGSKIFRADQTSYTLTTEYKKYTYTHDFEDVDIVSIRASFQLGAAAGSYFFDDAILDDGYRPFVLVPVEVFPIKGITTTDKVVAFTFDDGPDTVLSSQIADLFEANGGKATFFNIGKNLEGNESDIQNILNAGHEIGNHSMTHARLPDLATDELIYNDIVDFQELYTDTFEYTPKLFRAPFLDYGQVRNNDVITTSKDNRVGGVVTEQEMIAVNASLYANDASNPPASEIYNKINDNIGLGDIVLCHERTNTLAALTTLIPELKAAGYIFVTVSELLRIEAGFITINATDSRIKNTGSNYISSENGDLVLHRHNDAIYEKTNEENLFNSVKARTTAGVVLTFKTNSPKLNIKFRVIQGHNQKPNFAIFQNDNLHISTSFANVPGSEVLIPITSDHSGEVVTYKVTLPLWTDVHFSGLELENGYELTDFTVQDKPKIVGFGDSITHGRGQLDTYQTYLYLLGEKLGYELFNVAVGGGKTSQALADMIATDFSDIDIITILIGYNDLNGNAITAATYNTRYKGVVTALRAAHPNTKIYCITMTYTTTTNSNSTGIPAEDFRNVVREILADKQNAGDSNLFLIEGDDITDEDDLADPVHLNIEGASNFAESLFTEINKTLAVGDNFKNNKPNLFISPNPSNDSIRLNNEKEVYEVLILDMQGKKILSKKTLAPTEEISIESYPVGLYVVSYKDMDNYRFSLKLIKK